MTIASAIKSVLPGHKAQGATSNTTTEHQAYTGTTTSNSPAGMMEQAGAGEYVGEQQTAGASTGATGAATQSTYAGGASTYGSSGAGSGAMGGIGGASAMGDMVCVPGNVAAPVPVGEKKFIVTEDHAVQKQRVERWVEHQPVEREFVTRVEETGVVTAGATSAEAALGQERVVNEHTCYPVSQTTIHGVAGESVGMEGNRL